MPLKTILVPVTGADSDPVALSAAFAVARDFGSHVETLFVNLDARDAVPMLGEGMSGAMVEEIMRAAETESARARRVARRHVDAAAAAASVSFAEASCGVEMPTVRWQEVTGRPDEAVPAESRLADLVVFARRGLDDGQQLAVVEATLLNGGRPLLLVPSAVPEDFGGTVAVAWNGNAEAARAAAGALPFLLNADAVHVITAETAVTRAAAGSRFVDYLAWHGVNARLTLLKPGSEAVGKALTQTALNLGCSLLVMGGYGHSRMREMILGGVTRYILGNAALPVLMAH